MQSEVSRAWLSVNHIRKRIGRRKEFVSDAMERGELPSEQRGNGRYARLCDVEAWEATLVRHTSQTRGTIKVLECLAYLAPLSPKGAR